MPYHHGDLRAALVRSGRDQLAETGLAGFSVARVARRVGVSSGAPYRHFPDREALLAAVGQEVAAELTEALRRAADAAGDDPVERLAACDFRVGPMGAPSGGMGRLPGYARSGRRHPLGPLRIARRRRWPG